MSETFVPTNSLKETLAAGRLAIVLSLQAITTINIARIAKASGYDGLYVDMQHGAHTMRETTEICAAAINAGIGALVRVPYVAEHTISPLLEGGALGIIAPGVRNADEARELVSLCRFPPLGERSAGANAPQLGFQKMPKGTAAETLERLTLVVAMIESHEGVEQADAIAATPGVDVLLIGSNDLSGSYGVAGEYTHPKMVSAYETVARACAGNGKVMGIGGIKDDMDILRRYVRLGARLITAGSDIRYLMEIVASKAQALRALGGEIEADGRAG